MSPEHVTGTPGRLVGGGARPLPQLQAVDPRHLAQAAGEPAGAHQGRRQQARRPLSVAD